MKALAYAVGENETEQLRQRDAFAAYAQNRAWPRLSSEAFAVARTPGENLAAIIGMLAPGDVLLIADVAALAERPTQQEKIIRELIGKGIRIHTIELGDLNGHLPGLFAAYAGSAAIEAEMEQVRADAAAMEESISGTIFSRRSSATAFTSCRREPRPKWPSRWRCRSRLAATTLRALALSAISPSSSLPTSPARPASRYSALSKQAGAKTSTR